jgi:hypothetical protein
MNKVLMRAVIEYALFIGLSEDNIVNEDAAVMQFEQLSWILKGLMPAERNTFVDFIEEMASVESKDPRSKKRVEFLRALADNLGLTN